MKLKYVIIETFGGCVSAIVSDPLVEHADLVKHGKPISAGFCSFEAKGGEVTQVWVWGKSQSLNIDSRQEDKEIIQSSLSRDY